MTSTPRASHASPSIGQQLDSLGLTLDLEEDERVVEATVSLTTGTDVGGVIVHLPIELPPPPPGEVPVPHPLLWCSRRVMRENQPLSDEQRERIVRWLTANEIDPKFTARGPITIEYVVDGQRETNHMICFTEYYKDAEGHKTLDPKTRKAATYPRSVEQIVALEPEPGDPA